jgi:hypothetical protein
MGRAGQLGPVAALPGAGGGHRPTPALAESTSRVDTRTGATRAGGAFLHDWHTGASTANARKIVWVAQRQSSSPSAASSRGQKDAAESQIRSQNSLKLG